MGKKENVGIGKEAPTHQVLGKQKQQSTHLKTSELKMLAESQDEDNSWGSNEERKMPKRG